ncbi:MAG: cytochrome C biogenesis protein, partial [Lysobacterales bacterium CG_4_9_14_3_um_filter_62_6]
MTGAAADGATAVTFKVSYQGCADLGICYPPQHVQLTVALPAADATAALKSNPQPSAGLVIGAPAPTLNLLSGDVGQAPITFDPVANAALPLPPEVAFVFEAIADQPTELLLRFSMPKGYYLYRDHSSFALADADVGELGVPRWPTPQLFDDPEFGKVPVYFDVVEIPLSLARRHGAPGQIQLIGKFQGCESGGVCYPPMTRNLRVELPAATTEALAIAAARVQSELAQVTAQVTTPAPALAAANPAPAGVAASGLFKALLFALLGGLVLNLMPCVLPVLSLKAVSLAEAGETPETAHRHALWYTAGVMSTFALIGLLVLGLRAGGQALGWGFQLQQPLIVATMGYVMVVLGLGLSGVITLGSSLTNVGSGLATHSGARGDFFTGVLACVVA